MIKRFLYIILCTLFLLPSCASRRKATCTEQMKIEVSQTDTTRTDYVKKDSTTTETEAEVITVQTIERIDTTGKVTERTRTTTVKKARTAQRTGQAVTSITEAKTTATATAQTEKKESTKQSSSQKFFWNVIIFIFLLLVLLAISVWQLVKFQRRINKN